MTAAESVQPLPAKPSPHFTWDEFECHDALGTPYPLDLRLSRGVPLARELERVRELIGPFRPSSVYRTWAYHQAIYAAMRPRQQAPAGSQHLFGRAADIPCPKAMKFEDFAGHIKAVANRADSRVRYVKLYRKQRFAHMDIRERKTLLVEFDS